MVVMAALVGGVSSLEGGILGSFVTVFLIALASSLTPRYWMIVGVIFTGVVMFLPNGVLGGRRGKRNGLLSTFARRTQADP
jgi:branched-chain amino acid transport system permease protein